MAPASKSGHSWRSPSALAADSFRDDAGRAIATLSRVLRDIDRAEDAVQEAYVIALERWPRDGVPKNVRAWILTTARNRAIDRLRREKTGAEKTDLLARLDSISAPADEEPAAAPDDRLNLIFTCCHPALGLEAQIALTLRSLCGLSTEEIADAFLVPEQTMAQRLVRAKRKIRESGIPFAVPEPHELAERIDAVCTVIYLIFNQGYAATTGSALLRDDLCREAIRLGRIVAQILPQEPEILGLLALMLLTHARRGARIGASGEAVSLEDQDRSLWDREAIEEGLEVVRRANASLREGRFLLQAMLSAEHARTNAWGLTDWRAIVALYDRLLAIDASPVVELNRAAALAMTEGPAASLAAMDRAAAAGKLQEYAPYHASRAELLRRLARNYEAAASYHRALALTKNASQRQFLERRLAAVEGKDG